MSERQVLVIYWNSGGYYLECEPEVRYRVKAAAFRRASALGFTHVKFWHGWYSCVTKNFDIALEIPPTKIIPKRYRVGGEDEQA